MSSGGGVQPRYSNYKIIVPFQVNIRQEYLCKFNKRE